MSYIARITGLAVVVASWVGITGCEHEHGHGHRDKVIVVPVEKHDTRVYTHDRGERKAPEHEEHHDRD